MNIELCDDYIHLEKIETATASGLYVPNPIQDSISRAKVLDCGPGELRPDGNRQPMPCKTGDTVLVHAGAGLKGKIADVEYWFVFAGRKDIIGVVSE